MVIGLDLKACTQDANDRCDDKLCRRKQTGVRAQDACKLRCDADFLVRFTQRGSNRVGILRFDAPTWETDLPSVMRQMCGASGQKHVQAIFTLNQRHEDCSTGDALQAQIAGIEHVFKQGFNLPRRRLGEGLVNEVQAQGLGRQRCQRVTGHHGLRCGVKPRPRQRATIA